MMVMESIYYVFEENTDSQTSRFHYSSASQYFKFEMAISNG